MAYDNSARIEPKRSHQWFLDGNEAELFPNKKQEVEVSSYNSFPGILNVSPWANASSFHSFTGQFTERLYDPETARTINFDERNIASVGTGNLNLGRRVIEDPFGSDSSFGLSISPTIEDPRSEINYGGIRKVKVNQVKDCDNFMSVSIGHAYNRGDDSTLSTSRAYSEGNDNSLSMGLSFNRCDNNIISLGDTYNRDNDSFISMGQPYNKANDCTASVPQAFKENNSGISMNHCFSKDDQNVTTMGQNFGVGDCHGVNIPMDHTFKENNNVMLMSQSFTKADTNIISMGNRGDDNTIMIGHSYNTVDGNTISIGRTCNNVDNNNLSMGHSFSKGESNIISFGGLHDEDDVNSSGRLICSYDLLAGQSSAQKSETISEQKIDTSDGDTIASIAQLTASAAGTVSKEVQKGTRKIPMNNFPSNVRSLLSTGMLDGVPVKYIAWSREKELRAIIKGSGYLCGCQSCNFSKAINAYEFERHAGCKTKHPNNHIYFENGKTIYGIVQELRNTPQNLLFEVIQSITGSPINQKSFRLWKESFLAATRELQRIYGKEGGKQLS